MTQQSQLKYLFEKLNEGKNESCMPVKHVAQSDQTSSCADHIYLANFFFIFYKCLSWMKFTRTWCVPFSNWYYFVFTSDRIQCQHLLKSRPKSHLIVSPPLASVIYLQKKSLCDIHMETSLFSAQLNEQFDKLHQYLCWFFSKHKHWKKYITYIYIYSKGESQFFAPTCVCDQNSS